LNQWTAITPVIEASPWVGNGLSTSYLHYEEGVRAIVRGDITHDIYIDTTVRGGVIGLGLLIIAVLSSLGAALRAVWTRAGPIRVIALAAGCGLIALLTKGAVESIFEKPRLAVALGAMIGLIMMATRSSDEPDDVRPEALAAGSRKTWAAAPVSGSTTLVLDRATPVAPRRPS
jgi:O-antigen ligase